MGAAFDNLNDMARMLLNGAFNVSASCDFKQLGMAVCGKKGTFRNRYAIHVRAVFQLHSAASL